MGQSKRKASKRPGKKRHSKIKNDEPVPICVNPFPICTVPSAIPSRYRTMVTNLTSHVSLHRATALTALSDLAINHADVATDLIRSGTLPLIFPLIVDSDPDVALHAVGLLRNLAVLDSIAFSDAFNAFDPVAQVLVSRTDKPDWSAHLLSMLVCVTEHCDSVYTAPCVASGSVWALAGYVQAAGEASSAVVELFRNLAEGAQPLAQSLASNTTAMTILRAALHDEMMPILTRAHIAALFADMSRTILNLADESLPEIRSTLRECVHIDLSVAKRELIARAEQEKDEIEKERERQSCLHTGENIFQESINGMLAPEAIENSWRSLLQQFRDRIVALQTTAETIANLICVEDDGDSWPLARVVALTEVDQLAPMIASHIGCVIGNELFDVSDWDRVRSLLIDTIHRCVDCVSNLVLNGIVKGGDIATLAMSAIERYADSDHHALLEALGRLFALSANYGNPSPEQVKLLARLASSSPSHAIRCEFVSALAKYATGNAAKARIVGGFVADRLQDESIQVFLEAVNGLIDIFADDGVHAETMSLLNLLPRLNAAVADERRWNRRAFEDEEMMEEALQARTNLSAFLTYRASCP